MLQVTLKLFSLGPELLLKLGELVLALGNEIMVLLLEQCKLSLISCHSLLCPALFLVFNYKDLMLVLQLNVLLIQALDLRFVVLCPLGIELTPQLLLLFIDLSPELVVHLEPLTTRHATNTTLVPALQLLVLFLQEQGELVVVVDENPDLLILLLQLLTQLLQRHLSSIWFSRRELRGLSNEPGLRKISRDVQILLFAIC